MPRSHIKNLLSLAISGSIIVAASFSFAQDISDNRNASFMPSPTTKTPVNNSSPVSISPPPMNGPGTPAVVGSVPSPDATAATKTTKTSIETTSLGNVDPDSAGILSATNGGLGSGMWQDTPRALVERLIPELELPTASPTLNNLARRLLLTTAEVPKGKSTVNRSMTALRAEKLLALGDGAEAWQLSKMVKPDRIDDLTLRMVVESLLVNGDDKTACELIPSLISSHNSPEWQKLLVVCQTKSGDTKAAQLSIDLMREQAVKDDAFISIVSKNILAQSKQLPRQLTPLKAINVALLLQTGLPLPQEVFLRADASFVPALLKASAADEIALLNMAEKAAMRGLISVPDLGGVYARVNTKQEAKANARPLTEYPAGLRASLYQEIVVEQDTAKKINRIEQFIKSADSLALNSTIGQLVAEFVKGIVPQAEYGNSSAQITRALALAGRPDLALPWLKLARSTATSSQDIAAQMQNLWPLITVSGLVTDTEYGKELSQWLDATLNNADRAKRQQIGTTLLLFSSYGFAVPEEAWGRVADVSADNKRVIPPPAVLFDRLKISGTTGRKGEAVLLSLLLANNGAAETPIFVMTEIIRALRLSGLSAEAQGLAREVASSLFPQAAP